MLEQLKEKLKNLDIAKIRGNINSTNIKRVAKSSLSSVVPKRKHLLRTILLSASGLIVGLVLLFPYEIIVGEIIQSTAEQNNINLHYSDLRVSIRKLEMDDITVGTINAKPYKISSVAVLYSPLSAITRRVKVVISERSSKVVATISPTSINAKGSIDLADVALVVPNSPLGTKANGIVDLNLAYNTESGDGKVKVRSDAMSIVANKFPLTLEKVKLDADIVANDADIKLSTKDAFNVNMNGNVNINPQNIGGSLLNLRGNVLFFGQKQTFTLGGTVNNPAPNLGN